MAIHFSHTVADTSRSARAISRTRVGMLASLWLIASFSVLGQTAIATWDCTSASRVSTSDGHSPSISSVTGSITASNQGGSSAFSVRDYTGGTAPNAPYQRWWPSTDGGVSGNSWGGESAEVSSRYVEFTLAPNAGLTMTIDSIGMLIGGGGTGSIRANVYYSVDGFATRTLINVGALPTLPQVNATTAMTGYLYQSPISVPLGASFSLRVYPWYTGSASTSKYLYLSNVTIQGTTQVSSTPATVTTASVSSIEAGSAVCGGTVTSEGSASVTARGICWSTTASPTISSTHTTNGSGSGSFTSNLVPLAASTTYYVRAYAVSAAGTAYGSERSFTTASVSSFPGAEGFGAIATGGRGGAVYEVTNLNDDSNPGSFRYAVTRPGPRTVVFRVSGTIHLLSNLSISNGDLTIAGQTAPGDGICLSDYTLSNNANNVIIRYMRFRLGDVTQQENDSFWGRGYSNIIIDHCSFSWSIDELGSFYDNTNFTLQWCLYGESLYHSYHSKGNHGYGGIWGGLGATFHHNLIANNSSRNPRFAGSRTHLETASSEIVDFRNNVIFNWGFNSAYGGESGNHNLINNYYKPGPATGTGTTHYRIVQPSDTLGMTPQSTWYVNGNYVEGYSSISADNWSGGVQPDDARLDLQSFKLSSPLSVAAVATESAQDAYASVLANAGANYPARDSVDRRIIWEAQTGLAPFGATYNGGGKGIIDSQNDVGGWPALASSTAPTDTDHDGMPDSWETSHGLNINDASDRNGVGDGGYTNLETYLNSLVPGAALPVELTSFHASVVNSSVRLQWKTESEVNNYGFEIQRMRIGSGNSSAAIGFVRGSGTSNAPIDYRFVDVQRSSGRSAYRLKQIDLGGQFKYSGAIEVEATLMPAELELQQPYPNPFNPATSVQFTLRHGGDVRLRVFNLLGQCVAELFNGKAEASTMHDMRFDGSNLPSGTYVIMLENSGQRYVSRAVLLK